MYRLGVRSAKGIPDLHQFDRKIGAGEGPAAIGSNDRELQPSGLSRNIITFSGVYEMIQRHR